MAIATQFTKRLNLVHPIIQAPMAGGGDTPRLVAAVCEAGALGTIGAGYLSPDQRQTLPARPRCLGREGVAVAR